MNNETDKTPEHRIRTYIAQNLAFGGESFESDTSLVGAGIIDSVGILELVAYLQSEFGIEIVQEEVTLDNFDSVSRMAEFVRARAKMSSTASARV
jgi:acyl carrier protein